jgi:hypothetical protein
MMLFKLFSWVNGSETVLSFDHQMVTRSAFESEHKSAMVVRRELRAKVYDARVSNAYVPGSNDVVQRIEQHDIYIRFITFCGVMLGEHEHCSLFFIALNYLLSVRGQDGSLAINEAKINSVFFSLLKENREQTRCFYYDHQREFESLAQVNFMVSVEKTLDHVEQLTAQLSFQENPISITPLLMQFIGDTEQFAAIILWLLHRGVSTERILQTDLLQSFMLYHLAWLDSPDSPVQHLYHLLEQFAEARALVDAAGEAQCEDRGFHCRAITGTLTNPMDLHRVNVTLDALDFTPTKKNFEMLYCLFGLKFLHDALIWHTSCEDAIWCEILQQVLNQESTISTQLSTLINHVALENAPAVLDKLASFINEDTIEKMIAQRRGAVFHLLPYKAMLLTRISESDISHYLEQLRLSDQLVFDVIPQVLALFMAYRSVNKGVAVLVYETILDLVLENPQFLDDSYLIKQLRKFSEKEVVLTNRCARLQLQFDQCIAEQVSTVVLSSESYHLIEDRWLSYSRQLDSLNEIMPLTYQFPEDKYKLYAQLAKRYFSEHENYFILDDFIQSLGVTPELFVDIVSEYERLLIEILTTIDDDKIRYLIINKLESLDEKNKVWMHRKYGDGSVFDRASIQGNIGLIQWLEPNIRMDRAAINKAVMMAAEGAQWSVVDYFCCTSTHKPQQYIFKEVLRLAAAAGQLGTVQLLHEGIIAHLQEKHLVQAFMQAAAKGHRNVVQYFCHLEVGAPCAAIVAKAFKVAIQSDSSDVIDFIGNLPRNPLLVPICERALVHAATRDRLSAIQLLCNLRTNAPSQSAIEAAFLRAAQYGHFSIANYLCGSSAHAIRKGVMEQAILLGAKQGLLVFVQHCCELNLPSRKAIGRALKKAIVNEHDDVADYLRGLLNPVSKSQVVLMPDSSHHVVLLNRERPTLVSNITRSSSCGALSALGLFGSRQNVTRHGSLSDGFEPRAAFE